MASLETMKITTILKAKRGATKSTVTVHTDRPEKYSHFETHHAHESLCTEIHGLLAKRYHVSEIRVNRK